MLNINTMPAGRIYKYKANKGRVPIKKLARDVAKLKRMVSVEYKFHDTASSGSMANPTAALAGLLLTDIDVGDTNVTRDGNSVGAQSFQIKCQYQINSTAEDCMVRVMVVQSTFGEAIVPILSDINQIGTSLRSFRNVNQTRGYRVIVDRTVALNETGKSIGQISKYVKLRHKLKWNSVTGSSGHVYGQLWFWIFSDATTNQPTFDMQCRFRFTDS